MGYRYNPLSGVFDIVVAGSDTVISLEGNSGGAIGPDGSDIIHVVGDTAQGISSSGSGNTVTFTAANATTSSKGVASFNSAHFSVSTGEVSLLSSVPLSFASDSGTATPSSNSITIAGGSGVSTSASGNVVTITAIGGESAVDSLIPDSGTSPVVPSGASQISILGGTGIGTVGGTNTLTINLDSPVTAANGGTGLDGSSAANGKLLIGNGTGYTLANITAGTSIGVTNGSGTITVAFNVAGSPAIATSIAADSGTCTPSSNTFSIVGDTGITTTASGNQISIALDGGTLAIDTLTPDSGTSPVVPNASGNVTLTGGNGIATAGGTNVVTFNMESPFSGNFTFDATLSADTFDTTNTTTGLTITDNTITADGSNSNISLSLVPKGTGGVVVGTNLTVGNSTQDVSYTIAGASVTAVVSVEASGATDLAGVVNHRHSDTAAFGAHEIYLRSRNTHASPTIVQNNDTISILSFCGYDGVDWAQAAQIICSVDGTPGSNDMPGRIVFLTSPDGSQTPTEVIRLDSSQKVSFTQYTQNTLLYVGASGLITELGPLTNGQLLVGSTSNPPQAATLTEGTSIDITNAAGSITVSFDVTESPAIPISIVTDSGTCTPTSNSFSIVGAANVSTSASGNVITVSSSGSGGVVGPASSTDNALARWDGTNGSALQDSTVIVSDNGEMTNASQPAFYADLNTSDGSVTGDGTDYTLGTNLALTERFDQNSDFNTNGTFTAPVAGKYRFTFQVEAQYVGGSNAFGFVSIATTNKLLVGPTFNWTAARTGTTVTNINGTGMSVLIDMDAGDTAVARLRIDGGGKSINMVGGTDGNTYFCGELVC